MKKKILIVLGIVIIISLAIGFFMYQSSLRDFEDLIRNPTLVSLPKYENSECYYGEGFQDYTDYCKYYFSEDSNITEKIAKNKYFNIVTENDVYTLKSYFENFEGWVKFEKYEDKYDFNQECIDTADYFYIENKETCSKYKDYPDKYSAYNVYFFDVQTKTLFFIHNNI